MKILIDMNLTPDWCEVFTRHGIEAVHWSTIGNPRAEDHELLGWAQEHAHIVFTHDLDFGSILAASLAISPSVIQVRAQDVLPEHLEPIIISALHQFATQLEAGALIIIDEKKSRVRLLPLQRS